MQSHLGRVWAYCDKFLRHRTCRRHGAPSNSGDDLAYHWAGCSHARKFSAFFYFFRSCGVHFSAGGWILADPVKPAVWTTATWLWGPYGPQSQRHHHVVKWQILPLHDVYRRGFACRLCHCNVSKVVKKTRIQRHPTPCVGGQGPVLKKKKKKFQASEHHFVVRTRRLMQIWAATGFAAQIFLLKSDLSDHYLSQLAVWKVTVTSF